jgi:predicted lysophospholipase L1 biosynthesis ABC-type transport system permease subunit
VVGVVQDVKHYGPRGAATPEVFLSQWQVPYLAMSVAARTVGDPEVMIEPLRRAVLEHRATQPPHDFGTLARLARASTAEERFLSVLLGLLSAIALGLATTGVYGTIAYSVSHRRREIGVRMALGARGRAVALDVLRRGLAIAGIGLVVGLVGIRLLTAFVDGLLYGVRAADPATGLGVCALLLAVSAAAAWMPARRAASIAPTEALRSE